MTRGDDCGCTWGVAGALLGFATGTSYALMQASTATTADGLLSLAQLSITTVLGALLGKALGKRRAQAGLRRAAERGLEP